MMFKNLLLASSLFIGQYCLAQVNIIPKPQSVTVQNGSFTLSAASVLVVDAASKNSADFLNSYLKEYYGFSLKTSKTAQSANSISLTVKKESAKSEAYTLQVHPTNISIVGDDAAGCFYAVQTLIQLLPLDKTTSLAIPAATITDAPGFAYRGAMLDVGRHFFSVDFVKKFIDYLALHKMNTFHWHLTEDQGWRIEIKKYPKLTSVGGFRNGTIIGHHPGTGNDNQRYGGFYTQQQIKEVVKYAAERYITIIPEIEMPGHASAAIAAYPELSCFPNEATKTYFPKKGTWAGDTTGKAVQQAWGVYDDVFVPSENTFKFLENVIDEVVELFPSKYIHIGGDECPKSNWKRSAFCQQLMKEKGLKDEHALQSYFIQHMEKYINSKGKKIIGWDEILEGGLAPNAAVMSWHGESGGIAAAKENHNVIMTPTGRCYFDYSQTKKDDSLVIGGFLPLEKVYEYDPMPKELAGTEGAKYVLGSQANLWTEYVANPGKAEYMLFPRLDALSEVLWSTKENKSLPDFMQRLSTQQKRYDFLGIHYFKGM